MCFQKDQFNSTFTLAHCVMQTTRSNPSPVASSARQPVEGPVRVVSESVAHFAALCAELGPAPAA